MSNFKAGQKVVFKPQARTNNTPFYILPNDGEEVKLKCPSDEFPFAWIVRHYEIDADNREIHIHERHFRPLISSPASKELISQPITIEKSDVQIEVIENK